MRARVAALTRWGKTTDRAQATQPAREAWQARWEREADPEGQLSPAERTAAGERLMRAHMARMALRSSRVRDRRAHTRKEVSMPNPDDVDQTPADQTPADNAAPGGSTDKAREADKQKGISQHG